MSVRDLVPQHFTITPQTETFEKADLRPDPSINSPQVSQPDDGPKHTGQDPLTFNFKRRMGGIRVKDLKVNDFWPDHGFKFDNKRADTSRLEKVLSRDDGVLILIPMHRESPEQVNLVLKRLKSVGLTDEHNVTIVFLCNGYEAQDPRLEYVRRIFKKEGSRIFQLNENKDSDAKAIYDALRHPANKMPQLLRYNEPIIAGSPYGNGSIHSARGNGVSLFVDTRKGGLARSEVIAAEIAKATGKKYVLKSDCDLYIEGQDFVDFIVESITALKKKPQLKIIIGTNTLVGEALGEPIPIEKPKLFGWLMNSTVEPQDILPLVIGNQRVFGGTYLCRTDLLLDMRLGHTKPESKEESLYRQAYLEFLGTGEYEVSKLPVYVTRDSHASAQSRAERNAHAELQIREGIAKTSVEALREIFPSLAMISDYDWKKSIDNSVKNYFSRDLNRVYSQNFHQRMWNYVKAIWNTGYKEYAQFIDHNLNQQVRAAESSYYTGQQFDVHPKGRYTAFLGGIKKGITNMYYLENFLQGIYKIHSDPVKRAEILKDNAFNSGNRPGHL